MHTISQGMQYKRQKMDKLAQANAALNSTNTAVMALLAQLTEEMG